ncbi:MAG: hypothetical protein EPN79_15760 [Burkholderiaceae bacterium]|nr:MAG: hypothetical protein EPN79_15760 [Burkholderiaceae bacterium]
MASSESSIIGRLHRSSQQQSRGARAVSDTLVLLKSLSPILRAALMYPGPGASPEQYGYVVGRMSAAAANLTEIVVRETDPLELDSRWAKKSLQEMSSELVAHYWVSTVIARGGAGAEDDPMDAVRLLSEAVRKVVQLPIDLAGRRDSFDLSHEGAVRMSFLKAFAPLSMDIDRYAQIVNGRLESAVVDAAALQSAAGELLMDQALHAQEQLLADSNATEDDRRMTLQACIGHVGGILMTVWELTRGDALGTLADASSIDEGRAALTSSAFTHGFPVASLRSRTVEAVMRLVGTAQAAMAIVRARPAGPLQHKGG